MRSLNWSFIPKSVNTEIHFSVDLLPKPYYIQYTDNTSSTSHFLSFQPVAQISIDAVQRISQLTLELMYLNILQLSSGLIQGTRPHVIKGACVGLNLALIFSEKRQITMKITEV